MQCFAFQVFSLLKYIYKQKLNDFSMKKQETYAVRFVVRKSKVAQNEKSPLSVRVTVNAQRVEMSLGWYVTESIWDEKMQRCTGSTREAKGTNGFIDATTFRLTDIRQRLLIEGKEVTADFIKARYKGLPDPDEIPNPTIVELYDHHNHKFHELIGTNKHSISTYNRHLTSRGHLENFIKKVYGKADLSFEFVDFKFLNEYEHYLKSVRKCNHNSTMKYIKNAGKIINQAFAEGYLDQIHSVSLNSLMRRLNEIHYLKKKYSELLTLMLMRD
jgi:hypothetical protein